MRTKHTNHEVLVVINEACSQMECIFPNGIPKQALAGINAKYKDRPGYAVTYGTNMAQGGEDKSVVVVHYNRAVDYRDAAADLESFFLGVLRILWKRDIDYGTRESSVLAEVC